LKAVFRGEKAASSIDVETSGGADGGEDSVVVEVIFKGL